MQDNTFPHYETGNPDGKLLVFLSGFPDDTTSGGAVALKNLKTLESFDCCSYVFPDTTAVALRGLGAITLRN